MREHELVIKLGNKGSLTIPSQDQFGTGNLFLTVPSPAGCRVDISTLCYLHDIYTPFLTSSLLMEYFPESFVV